MKLQCEYLVRPRRGDAHCGDAVVVRTASEVSLLAVIDGLGHGFAAEVAARAATALLNDAHLDGNTTAASLVEGLHDALRGTRGAAAMLCLVKGRDVEGCGVGNVDLRTLGAAVSAVLSPGILGARVHRLRTFSGTLSPGARIAIFSDGLSSQFDLLSLRNMSLASACHSLMESYGRDHDDVSVLLGELVH